MLPLGLCSRAATETEGTVISTTLRRGAVTVAIDVLRQMVATLPREHAEIAEAWGLLGRAQRGWPRN